MADIIDVINDILSDRPDFTWVRDEKDIDPITIIKAQATVETKIAEHESAIMDLRARYFDMKKQLESIKNQINDVSFDLEDLRRSDQKIREYIKNFI